MCHWLLEMFISQSFYLVVFIVLEGLSCCNPSISAQLGAASLVVADPQGKRWCEDTRLYGKLGRLSLIALSVVDSLAQSFLVIDRSSSISQVHAFNVTDCCYRMTRKLNESNAGWKSSTQAPVLEVGWINILCSSFINCLLVWQGFCCTANRNTNPKWS